MFDSQSVYWSWWAGAVALAAIAVLHYVFLGRLFGVSGSIARVVDTVTGNGKNVGEHGVFLAAVFVGAAIAAWSAGDIGIRFDLGAEYSRVIGDGPTAFVALIVGGVLTGFGTRWAAGCTSGHGLCGTSRLQPGSLVATATFFGVGIAVSHLLEVLS